MKMTLMGGGGVSSVHGMNYKYLFQSVQFMYNCRSLRGAVNFWDSLGQLREVIYIV